MMRLRGWKIRCGNLREAGNEYSFIITAISEFYFRCQKIKHPQLNIMCNVRHFLLWVDKTDVWKLRDRCCSLPHNVWTKNFLINEDIFSIFEVLTVEEVWCLALTMKYPSTLTEALFWRGFVIFVSHIYSYLHIYVAFYMLYHINKLTGF